MPTRVRLFFPILAMVFFFVAAAPLYRELSRPKDIWWTPHTMLVRAEHLPMSLASAAAGGPMVLLFILVATGRLTYRDQEMHGSSGRPPRSRG
jgi:hypothetical protein